MKRYRLYTLIMLLVPFILSGCTINKYKKYDDTFFDTFDTITQVVGYAESKEEFDEYMEKIHSRFLEFHKLFDIYNDYEGINNVKTINDNAGIRPVKVEKEIIDLILFSKKWYEKAGRETNIAMGPVIKIWSKYRDNALDNPKNAKTPPMEELKEASRYTNIDKVIVDEKNSTVFLEDPNMSLDVGAVAKGYVVEIVGEEIEKEGFKSGLINGGGNIKAIGKPQDHRKEKWGVGIQNPDTSLINRGNVLETIFVKNTAVVSSGDYQRYFTVNGKKYHHIIDPNTLMPGEFYKAITIITPSSAVGDFLSTSAFLLPYKESRKLIESLEDTEALWVMKDGSVKATKGMEKIMLSKGATGG